MNKTFYTYVDVTNDGHAFYVGKGTRRRLLTRERNAIWKNIARKHGQHRVIVFETLNERWALDREIELIALLKTRHQISGHWGANLSDGGEGPTGYTHTAEARQKIIDALRVRVISDVTRKKLSDRQRGDKNYWANHAHTDEHRRKISEGIMGEKNGFYGRKHTDETRQNISRKLTGNQCAKGTVRSGKRFTCKACGQIGHYAKTCPNERIRRG